MKKILIAGGSGLIGRRLTQVLQRCGCEVAWLSRGHTAAPGVQVFQWDIDAHHIDAEAVLWADAVIHLAGASLAGGRWTKRHKRTIIDSRVQSLALLHGAMMRQPHAVQCVIAASAVGYYGDRGSELLTETSAPGRGFLSESVMQWEEAIHALQQIKVRLVTMRFGMVLSGTGGALPKLMQALPFGIAPLLGNGKQLYPWIHISDLSEFIAYTLQHEHIAGVYNVSAHVHSQKQVMQSLQRVFNNCSVRIPVPVFILRILLGEMADAVLISQNVCNEKMRKSGYVLQYPELIAALTQIKNSHT